MKEKHQAIIKKLKNSLSLIKNVDVRIEFLYSPFNKKYPKAEIDILAILNGTLFLFEIKSSFQEKDAKKQLNFHKEQFQNLKNILLLKYKINFSDIKLFWVSEEYNVIEDIETQELMAFDPTFLENPLEFLSK